LDWLVSNYKYCVQHERFWQPLLAYIDFGTRRTPFALEKRAPFYVPDFYFSEVVERYRSLFGRERVLVLRYEDFVADASAYGAALSQFIGVPLPDFARKAAEKVLESAGSGALERVRLENMSARLAEAGFAAERLEHTGASPESLPLEV